MWVPPEIFSQCTSLVCLTAPESITSTSYEPPKFDISPQKRYLLRPHGCHGGHNKGLEFSVMLFGFDHIPPPDLPAAST